MTNAEYIQTEGEKVYNATTSLFKTLIQKEMNELIDEDLNLEEVYIEFGQFEVGFDMTIGFEKSFYVSYLGGDASVRMEEDIKEICLKAIEEYELDKEANS